MGILFFYLTALFPIAVGSYLWVTKKTVVWQEWLGGTAIALIVAGIMHVAAFYGQTGDLEVWSGQVTKTVHHPYWYAEWTEIVTSTDSEGNTSIRTEHHSRSYPEHWVFHTTLNQTLKISKDKFNELKEKFGGKIEISRPHKDNFQSGDPNIYTVYNRTGYVHPVTDVRRFENRVKAAPTTFSFVKVPAEVPIYKWSEPMNIEWSDRLKGTAKKAVTMYDWDVLNARLGPIKKVNLVAIGFDSEDALLGQYQEADWMGGKKNDLVITFGGNPEKPSWAYVFGWTENDIVKRNLESIVLTRGFVKETLSLIEAEVVTNYELKDWDKFDYISIEPSLWSYVTFIILLILTQVAFYAWAHKNEFGD